jgi:hypothetical protein
VNLNSFKKEINTYLVELFQGSDDLSMDDNIVIFQCKNYMMHELSFSAHHFRLVRVI